MAQKSQRSISSSSMSIKELGFSSRITFPPFPFHIIKLYLHNNGRLHRYSSCEILSTTVVEASNNFELYRMVIIVRLLTLVSLKLRKCAINYICRAMQSMRSEIPSMTTCKCLFSDGVKPTPFSGGCFSSCRKISRTY